MLKCIMFVRYGYFGMEELNSTFSLDRWKVLIENRYRYVKSIIYVYTKGLEPNKRKWTTLN